MPLRRSVPICYHNGFHGRRFSVRLRYPLPCSAVRCFGLIRYGCSFQPRSGTQKWIPEMGLPGRKNPGQRNPGKRNSGRKNLVRKNPGKLSPVWTNPGKQSPGRRRPFPDALLPKATYPGCPENQGPCRHSPGILLQMLNLHCFLHRFRWSCPCFNPASCHPMDLYWNRDSGQNPAYYPDRDLDQDSRPA